MQRENQLFCKKKFFSKKVANRGLPLEKIFMENHFIEMILKLLFDFEITFVESIL
jgi:hypothetical protein